MFLAFLRNRHGGVAPLLALSIIPVMGAVATSVDYSRASMAKAEIQSALDSALLLAAKDNSATWDSQAANAFHAVLANREATIQSVTFRKDGGGNFVGEVSAKVDMKFGGFVGVSSIGVTANAAVKAAGETDESCILTLDKNGSLSHASMVFNGAPNISLAGCSIRSNTSLKCNGHDGGATAAMAAGNVAGCGNPKSAVRALPDIYERLASHIDKICGGMSGGVTWTVGTVPPEIKTLSKSGYTEYHVCGDLTLSGAGVVTGGGADSVIVVENGGIKLDADAAIQFGRTAIVLTGNNALPSALSFPNGNGKRAQLTISPPENAANPWQGIALYQDPALTRSVDHNWGPGASLNVDGVVYLPNSEVTMHGVAASGANKCTKFVVGNFVTNGAVALNFTQEKAGCKKIGMKQWADTPVHMVR